MRIGFRVHGPGGWQPAPPARDAVSKVMAEHPGSPPRAMSLSDKKDWSRAVIFQRGNPGNRGDEFERQWLSFLGGGKFEEGKSPRLAFAEKITDSANPLTARVMVNRVWAWHFGTPLAEPGDFGMQTPSPVLLPLLDALALSFRESGGSLKQLHRLLLTSQCLRLAASGPEENNAIDEANSRFWKWNRRRLDFETMRDRVLASSGALDTSHTGGRSVNLDSEGSDPAAPLRLRRPLCAAGHLRLLRPATSGSPQPEARGDHRAAASALLLERPDGPAPSGQAHLQHGVQGAAR